jgi:hypothetical protein
MTVDQDIVLHQTVHGYRSGHELLQTSVRLAPDVQRTLLVQSDLSGPRLAAGFEEYASGYPLEAVGSYVLARTWYAPEMERPGCVWTHSLLIQFADLARLPAPSRLKGLFRRPLREKAYGRSQLPELVLSAVGGGEQPHPFSLDVATGALEALYGAAGSTAVLFAENSALFESLVMAIWSQQWPRLRRGFRFCSGALAAREQDGNAFDLLVAPLVLRSRLPRELPSATIVEDVARASPIATWVHAGVVDLCGGDSGLREFLWAYGADAVKPRESWKPLAETFELLQTERAGWDVAAERIVAVVGASFRASGDCGRLKLDLFGPDARFRSTGLTPSRVLLQIARTTHAAAFMEPELKLPEQARKLWTSDSGDATDLLQALVGAEPLNELGERILGALCDAVGPTAAMELETRHRGLLTVLVDRSPGLATSPALWRVPLDRQREFLDLLARKGQEHVRSSVGAMLAAGAREIAGDAARALGDDAAQAVLDAIDRSEDLLDEPLGAGWDDLLRRDARAVVSWLRRSPPSSARLSFAIAHLDPHSEAAASFPPQAWLAAASDGFGVMEPGVRTRCAGFVLAIGLRISTSEGAPLVALSYPDVYRAAASPRDDLPYDVWRWLSDDLPPLHWYRQWDRCERLSLGLADRFARPDWPLQEFLRAAREQDALRQALEMAREQRSSLGSRLRGELDRGALSVTADQRRIIESRRW